MTHQFDSYRKIISQQPLVLVKLSSWLESLRDIVSFGWLYKRRSLRLEAVLPQLRSAILPPQTAMSLLAISDSQQERLAILSRVREPSLPTREGSCTTQ